MLQSVSSRIASVDSSSCASRALRCCRAFVLGKRLLYFASLTTCAAAYSQNLAAFSQIDFWGEVDMNDLSGDGVQVEIVTFLIQDSVP